MICADAEGFAAALPRTGGLVGLDLGTRTIGLAVSDGLRQIASPLMTLKRVKFTQDAAAILDLAGERALAGIVLGLPLNMDGSEGPRAQSTRAFARNLERLTPLPIGFWDERLTTVAAERMMVDLGMKPEQRKARIDEVAASIILQDFLDARRERQP